MKNIKYRFFDGSKMCPVGTLEFFEGGGYNINEEFPSTGKDPYPLMQFTGLLDKSGKEIYEGDIVRWSDGDYESPSNPRIAEVRFDPELCFFAFNVGDNGNKFGFSNFAYRNTEKHLEIIGNIYENPNLLNQ